MIRFFLVLLVFLSSNFDIIGQELHRLDRFVRSNGVAYTPKMIFYHDGYVYHSSLGAVNEQLFRTSLDNLEKTEVYDILPAVLL